MIAVIQRVTHATVSSHGEQLGAIDNGLVVLLGVEKTDEQQTLEKLANRILNYRIFNDQDGKMNRSVRDIGGGVLVVSQFTLVADTAKGNRPGFSKGASPQKGETLYNAFVDYMHTQHSPVQCGRFGADMQVELVNDGPVTFHLSV